MHLLRHQRIEVSVSPTPPSSPIPADVILSRAQRAHVRLSWETRLARNTHPLTEGLMRIKLFGVPEYLTTSLGLAKA